MWGGPASAVPANRPPTWGRLSWETDGRVAASNNPGRVKAPYWLLAVFATAFAAIAWIRWRYSLRTLLVVMTLAAMGLGAIVYALR